MTLWSRRRLVSVRILSKLTLAFVWAGLLFEVHAGWSFGPRKARKVAVPIGGETADKDFLEIAEANGRP